MKNKLIVMCYLCQDCYPPLPPNKLPKIVILPRRQINRRPCLCMLSVSSIVVIIGGKKLIFMCQLTTYRSPHHPSPTPSFPHWHPHRRRRCWFCRQRQHPGPHPHLRPHSSYPYQWMQWNKKIAASMSFALSSASLAAAKAAIAAAAVSSWFRHH